MHMQGRVKHRSTHIYARSGMARPIHTYARSGIARLYCFVPARTLTVVSHVAPKRSWHQTAAATQICAQCTLAKRGGSSHMRHPASAAMTNHPASAPRRRSAPCRSTHMNVHAKVESSMARPIHTCKVKHGPTDTLICKVRHRPTILLCSSSAPCNSQL